MQQNELRVENFYIFNIKNMWSYFKSEKLSFWMICGYLFFEFVRPQGLFPQIAVAPWSLLLICGAFGGAILDKSVTWVKSPANAFIISFLIIIIISSLAAAYPEVSKKHFMDFFGWFIIYFLIINIVNTRERFYVFLFIYIVSTAKIAVGCAKIWAMRGFSFTSWGLSGPAGFFQNSGELAVLMVMLFPLCYYLYFSLKPFDGLIQKIILIIFIIAPVMTVLGASSRGSQIALAVQLLIMFRKNLFKVKPLVITAVLVTALFALLPQEQKDRFAETGEDKSSQQRILYWKNGWEMIKDHPGLGVGYYNFIPYFEAHYSSDMLYEFVQLPHNIFIQVGTDTGFLGLMFFGLLITYTFYAAYRIQSMEHLSAVDRGIGAGLGYGFLGFFIAGQFVTITYYPFMWIHLAFLVALLNISRTKNLTQ